VIDHPVRSIKEASRLFLDVASSPPLMRRGISLVQVFVNSFTLPTLTPAAWQEYGSMAEVWLRSHLPSTIRQLKHCGRPLLG